MRRVQLRSLLRVGILWLSLAISWTVCAGGSGLNTVVIINQASSNSCELANYFCERRGVPPENVLRVNWTGPNTSWSSSDLQAVLLNPLLEMLDSRQLSNQIDYVVLSMDIPFQTSNGSTVNGTTSALFYGLKANDGSGSAVTNSYAGSEAIFQQSRPASAPGYSFLTTMLTADSLAQAKQLVDQGVAGDGTFPRQPVVLAKSSDPDRNIRYAQFDNAIANVKIRGVSSILRTNSNSLWGNTNFLGYETGLANFSLSPRTFVPGAIADSLTSFGGIIFGPNGQTSLLAFISAGAAGSYGTVSEPGTDTQKFPDPQVYFYQSRGFSLAESYYQSLNVPYMGLVVSEPLASPFRQLAWGRWLGVVSNAPLSGTASLSVKFTASDADHPLQQIDLFVDGKFFSTLTNLAPSPGNLLTVTFNGYPVVYSVPANATLQTVARELAAKLNDAAVTNLTKALAFTRGDRLELHSLSTNRLVDPFYVAYSHDTNSPGNYFTVAYLPYPVPPQVTPLSPNPSGAFALQVDTPDSMPFSIQASTNLVDWLPLITNLSGGPLVFTDPDSTNCQKRFYRVAGFFQDPPPAPPPPDFTVLLDARGGDLVRINYAARPYLVQVSTNLTTWTSIFTNTALGKDQITAQSSLGSAGALTTFLTASRSSFIDSEACGRRAYTVLGTPQPGAWIQLTFTLTNGASVALAVTNQTGSITAAELTAQLCALVNAHPALQGSDGVVAEDYALSGADTPTFNLRVRSPGVQAAALRVTPKRSGISILPSSSAALNSNLADLRSRNHLYLTAGVTSLPLTFALDTTTLADGFHELTAVAYEGSHVRTQSKAVLPLQIQNSPLAATLTLLDFPDPAPVQGTYHIQVAANTNNVSSIRLFSTGGLLEAVTNQSTATFTLNAPALGAGLHPFYALVETTDGLKYRTETRKLRFLNSF